MLRRLAGLLIGLAALVWGLAPVSAAGGSQTPSGITVSPAFQQVQVLPSETQHELIFSVTNHRASAEIIQLSTQDFNALSDSGGLFFVGTNPTQLQKKYGLAKWLSLPQDSVTVAPQQTVQIKAAILNLPTFASGGHYGALMLALADQNTVAAGSNRIAIHPIASSLLFVNKVGGDIHKLKLSDVSASHSFLALPSSVTLRFYNDGNTHLIPRGSVTITSPQGKVVRQGIINDNSDIILPQVYRRYTVPLRTVGPANAAGHYQLTVAFRFDGYDQFRQYQSSIFLATPVALVTAIVIGVVVLLVLGLYLKRRYSRKPTTSSVSNFVTTYIKRSVKKSNKIH